MRVHHRRVIRPRFVSEHLGPRNCNGYGFGVFDGILTSDGVPPARPESAARSRRSPRPDQRGFALIEVSAAIVVLAILGVAVTVGFLTVVRSSEVQRAASENAVVQRDAVTHLAELPYTGCATAAEYQSGLDDAYSPASGTVSVAGIEYWNTGTTPATFRTGSCDASAAPSATNGDAGIQRITYEVTTSRSGRTVARTRTMLKQSPNPYPEPPTDPPPGGQTCTITADTVPSQLRTNWVDQFAGQRDTVHADDDHMDILYLNGSRRFSYVWFRIDSSTTCNEGTTLGAGRTILSARLELYTFNIGGLPACGANSCWHALERVGGSWNPATLTWNNQPCTGQNAVKLTSCRPDGQPGVLFEHGTGAFDWSPRFQLVEAPMLTADVQSMYSNPSANHGWIIREACDSAAGPYSKACGTVSPGFQFRSRTAANQTQRPRLVVTFQ